MSLRKKTQGKKRRANKPSTTGAAGAILERWQIKGDMRSWFQSRDITSIALIT
jgi:hypothetical protein